MAGVTIDGVTYYGNGNGGKDYPNPYYKTDHGLYNVVESQFCDYLQREGAVVTDYWTGEEYRCFFRRNKDTNQTNDNISVYYPVGNGINPGTVINYYGKRYLILNQESLENRVYHRSDGINADIMVSTYNKTTGEEICVPAFAYDMTGSLVRRGSGDIMMAITAGDTEFMTGDNELSRKLAIDCEFEALGCYFKIVNVNYKTGICRIQASITQRVDNPIYKLEIDANETYTQGDAVKLTAKPTINDGPVANPTLIWTSSNPDIVTIDDAGNALFAGVGTCAISCYWKEHDIIDTVYVEVVAIPVVHTYVCEIDGYDAISLGSTEDYVAIFYQADGVTEDATIAPIWSLDLPSDLKGKVTITESGNTATVRVPSGSSMVGRTFGLNLTDESGNYHATITIRIKSWF